MEQKHNTPFAGAKYDSFNGSFDLITMAFKTGVMQPAFSYVEYDIAKPCGIQVLLTQQPFKTEVPQIVIPLVSKG